MARHKTKKIELFDSQENCYYSDSEGLAAKLAQSESLIIEAGCGDGKIALWLAAQNPDSLVVGVDLKVNRLAQGGRAALEQRLDNVIFIKSQIQRLDGLIPASCASQIWITFPDPFPKSRHHKRRLGKPSFLGLYHQWLAVDGRLLLKTDDTTFFVDSIEGLQQAKWEVTELTDDLHADYPKRFPQTTFEQEFVTNGLPINFLTATPPVDKLG